MEEKISSKQGKEEQSVYWVHDEVKELYKEPKVGDVLLTSHAFPEGNVLYWKDFDKKEDYRISIGNLKDYLKLLELIILNERVIVGRFPGFEARITPEEYEKEAVKLAIDDYLLWYRVTSALSLVEDLRNRVKNIGIIVDTVVNDEKLPLPDELVKRYIKIDESLKVKFGTYCKDMNGGYTIRGELAERVTFSILAPEYGGPLYVSEFCRLAGIPYWLSERELAIIENQENMENSINSQLIGALKERLDSGALHNLEKIKKFGVSTIFPESPIASKILQESNKPEDLNIIALQMRDEFAKLRSYMHSLQEEILKEETSIEKKIKITREIELLCSELWKTENEGWKTIFNSITGLLNLAVEGATMPKVSTVTGIVEYLINQPYELILRAMRRRKLRVLLETKKKFLESSNWTEKIATIFRIPIEDVRQAQQQEMSGKSK